MVTTNKPKMAPVQGFAAGIPWELHLEAYDVYCTMYGKQPALIDLEGRNCRGGFGTNELDKFIPGWRERVSEVAALRAELLALTNAIKALAEKYYVLEESDDVSIAEGIAYGEIADELIDTLHKDKV